MKTPSIGDRVTLLHKVTGAASRALIERMYGTHFFHARVPGRTAPTARALADRGITWISGWCTENAAELCAARVALALSHRSRPSPAIS